MCTLIRFINKKHPNGFFIILIFPLIYLCIRVRESYRKDKEKNIVGHMKLLSFSAEGDNIITLSMYASNIKYNNV